MSYALTRLTGDGSTQTFTIGFAYRDKADIVVKVDGATKALTTDYTFVTDSQIRFNTAPANNAAIVIRRATSQNARLVDYVSGAVFKESDLDTDSTQGFFMAQESIDIANDSITKNDSNLYDAENIRVTNVANPVASTDAATKAYVQSFADSYNSRYYGESATAPTDPAPSAGDLWWDSANNIMKAYNGSGWQNATSAVAASSNRAVFTVGSNSGSYTGSTTTFPATYDAGFVDVFLNGSKLIDGTDFTATNGTTIVLANAASSGDKVDIVAHGAALLTDTNFLPLSGGTLTGNLVFGAGARISLPNLDIYNDVQDTSVIEETGLGSLIIKGTDVRIQTTSGEDVIKGEADGAVTLYYNNNAKLATTNTGISVTGTLSATGYNDTNWNTAYGWGDHSQAGYLTSYTETDPVFSAHDASNVTATKISNWDTAYNNHITGVSYSGSTLTLTQQDGGTITTTINTSGGGGGGGETLAQTLAIGNTTSGNDISFGDNDKAAFGASNDLQIYHDGSNSYISDTGTGRLNVKSNVFRIYNAAGDEISANFVQNGAVSLYHDNAKKLETTATGIDVTGTAVTYGVKSIDNLELEADHDNNSSAQYSNVIIKTDGSEKMRIDSSGNVGIGTSNPDHLLHIEATNDSALRLTRTGVRSFRQYVNGTGNFVIRDLSATPADRLTIDTSGNVGIGTTSPVSIGGHTGVLTLHGDNATAIVLKDNVSRKDIRLDDGNLSVRNSSGESHLMVTDGGNVGIGTSSPAFQFHLYNSITGAAQVEGGSRADIFLVDSGSATDQKRQTLRSNDGAFIIGTENDARTAFTEKMRIDSSGNLLAGKTSDSINTVGGQLNADGLLVATRDGGNTAVFNRKTSDGDIVQFRKDNTIVGSIGVLGSRPFFASTNCGIRLGAADLLPATSSGVISDNVVSLGSSSGRWKDLYLSNKVTNPSGALSVETSGGNQLLLKGSSELVFHTNNSERSRIDSSGNLLVGKTLSSFNTAGVEFASSGRARFTRDSANVIEINRTTNGNGSLVTFNKDGTTAGSIGVNGSGIYLNSVATGYLSHNGTRMFNWDASKFYPQADGAKDLGHSSYRWKDLYLSNKVTNPSGALSVETSGGNQLLLKGSSELVFHTNNSERSRIDSSGNLLVGKTSDSINTVGGQLNADGLLVATRDGGNTAVFNRKTSDGDIVQFRKDNTIVGSIGVLGSRPFFASTNCGIRLGAADLLPATSSGVISDNVVSLGSSSGRWKDIYLSGTVKASGLTYPTSDGTANQVMVTDGSGNLSFASRSLWSSGGLQYIGSSNVLVSQNTPSTSSNVAKLNIFNGNSGITPQGNSTVFLDSSGSNTLQMGTGTYNTASIYFGNSFSATRAGIEVNHGGGSMAFRNYGSERMRLNSSGYLGIGTTIPAFNLTVHAGGSYVSGPSGTIIQGRNTNSDAYAQLVSNSYGSAGIYFGDSADNDSAGVIYSNYNDRLDFRGAGSTRMSIVSSGDVGIGTTAPTSPLDINDNRLRIRDSKTPASATDTGNKGEICYDSNYMYVCVATNTWKRAALASW